jgi:drug/metabolite transporter (DMT)-like permease
LINNNYTKGIVYGIISLLFLSLEPIIANSRPVEIDSIIYGAMTSIIMSMIFFPLMLLERKRLKSSMVNTDNALENVRIKGLNSPLNGFKNHRLLFIYLGINFAIVYVLFFWGYELAGAINGSLAQKMDLIFALLFGYLINKEKITKTQIFFSIVLFFGLTLAITEGFFYVIEFNLGVVLLIITVMLWMLAHAITRPILERKEISPFQLVFIRNLFSGIILFVSYLALFGNRAFVLLLNPINLCSFFLMGIVYGIDLYCYYLALSHIKITKVSILMAPSLIITTFFATLFLTEVFTLYHLIGSIIIITSIVIIIRLKEE